MAFICAISGVQPEEPCLSKSGYVFERRLIEKHLQESSICPVTGEPLTVEDLIPIKGDGPVKPRPCTATTIPGLLALLQNEWDALALETFNLRSHVDVVRKQLSYSLYQHDAATRVIARLLKERDSAQREVEELRKQLLEFRANYDVHAIETGLDQDAIERLQALAKALMGQRKKRELSQYTTPAAVAQFALKGEYRTHSSTIPGIFCVALDTWRKSQDPEAEFCFSGGADGSLVYFDLTSATTVSKATSHLKAINALASHAFAPIVVSGSEDKCIRVWRLEHEHDHGEGDPGKPRATLRTSHVLKHHKAAVTDVSLHPSGEYLLSVSADGAWGVCDVDSGRVVKLWKQDVSSVCKRAKFHPDGLIAAGAGADGRVHVLDLRKLEMLNALESQSGHHPLVDLDFSENGYYMATVDQQGAVELWDLRKSARVSSAECNVGATRLKFDPSGRMLAVASTALELLHFVDKTTLEPCGRLDQGHEGYITDFCFGAHSQLVLTTCRDRAMRLFC